MYIKEKNYSSKILNIKTSHNRCILKYVEDVEDRSNTHKGCNAMYVEDVEDIKTSHNRCILKYVEDVEDRSNTHKGCNAMYVELTVIFKHEMIGILLNIHNNFELSRTSN